MFGFFVFASAGLPGLSGFVGEFLVLLGTFAFNPVVAAIATFVMILAAGYLLWMFQRIVFGELSDFLASLGDHLTDMTPGRDPDRSSPLGALVVIFGLLPGLLLNLVQGTVTETLAATGPSARDRDPEHRRSSACVLIVLDPGHRPDRLGARHPKPRARPRPSSPTAAAAH